MAGSTPNMDLRQWNLATDFFESGNLSANWTKVDQHDHTTGKGVQIPTNGLVDGAVTQAKLANDIDFGYTVWRPITNWFGGPSVAAVHNGTHLLRANNWGDTTLTASGDASGVFRFDPSQFAIAGRTVKVRVRSILATNLVVPAATFTVALYSATSTAGSSGSPNKWGGSVVTGSTISYTTPTNGSMLNQISAEIDAPAAGYYAIGVFVSVTAAAGSIVDCRGSLEMRQV